MPVDRRRAGEAIVREGEVGDRFYVIESGEVEILGRTFGPGESFGEIALLRDVPRTATVTAVTDVALVTLERDIFVAAVTGHGPAHATAERGRRRAPRLVQPAARLTASRVARASSSCATSAVSSAACCSSIVFSEASERPSRARKMSPTPTPTDISTACSTSP